MGGCWCKQYFNCAPSSVCKMEDSHLIYLWVCDTSYNVPAFSNLSNFKLWYVLFSYCFINPNIVWFYRYAYFASSIVPLSSLECPIRSYFVRAEIVMRTNAILCQWQKRMCRWLTRFRNIDINSQNFQLIYKQIYVYIIVERCLALLSPCAWSIFHDKCVTLGIEMSVWVCFFGFVLVISAVLSVILKPQQTHDVMIRLLLRQNDVPTTLLLRHVPVGAIYLYPQRVLQSHWHDYPCANEITLICICKTGIWQTPTKHINVRTVYTTLGKTYSSLIIVV